MRTATKGPVHNQPILVNLKNVSLQATLGVPEGAAGVVVLAHPASSAQSNFAGQTLAEFLRSHGLATLLVNLLTFDEDRALRMKIDSKLLAERLAAVVRWVRAHEEIGQLPIGVYAPSLAAFAAFDTAAAH